MRMDIEIIKQKQSCAISLAQYTCICRELFLLSAIPAFSFISFIIAYILYIPIPIFLYHCPSFHTEKEWRVWFVHLDRAFGSIQSTQSHRTSIWSFWCFIGTQLYFSDVSMIHTSSGFSLPFLFIYQMLCAIRIIAHLNITQTESLYVYQHHASLRVVKYRYTTQFSAGT